MSKKIFLGALIATLIIPQVTLAAWWNPFSWNWNALFNTPVQEISVPIPNPEIPVSAHTPTLTQPTEIQPQKPINKPTQVPTPVTPTPIAPVIKTPTPAIEQSLQIQNVKNDITKKLVIVSWSTSKPTRSQLLLNNGEGKGYESLSGISTSHKIRIESPNPSAEYIYKIVARTEDNKYTDDFYGSFTAIREFAATNGGRDNGCIVIYVKDSLDKPASYMDIKISGTYGEKTTFQLPQIKEKTDINGKVKLTSLCENKTIKTLRVTGENLDTKLEITTPGTPSGAYDA